MDTGAWKRDLSYPLALVMVLCLAVGTVAADKEKGAATKDTKKIDVKGLSLTVPAAWQRKEVRSRNRPAEFEITPVDGDHEPAEFIVYQFGGGREGGDADANIERWIGQVEPAGRKATAWSGTSKVGKYHLVDITGNYKKPIGPPIQQQFELKKGWRVLNVRLEADGGLFFLKFAGPEKTIASAMEVFRTSFGADVATEREIPRKKPAKTP
jgi:gluconolactonase